jgi:hypothetical protein
MIPYIVQPMVVEIPRFMVAIMESLMVRRISVRTSALMAFFMESCRQGETIYPMT